MKHYRHLAILAISPSTAPGNEVAGVAKHRAVGAEALAQEAHGDSEGGGEEEMGEKN